MKDTHKELIAELSRTFSISIEKNYADTFVLRCDFKKAITTIRVVLKERGTDSDVTITNMTTFPEDMRGMGYGGRALKTLISICTGFGYSRILAVQVQKNHEAFWVHRGFDKLNNPTNDFRYRNSPEVV